MCVLCVYCNVCVCCVYIIIYMYTCVYYNIYVCVCCVYYNIYVCVCCVYYNIYVCMCCVFVCLFLQMIGSVLKESVAIDSSLSVVCPALDSIFDIFGDDSCPAELFKSLALLPVLLECRASFIARVSQSFLE